MMVRPRSAASPALVGGQRWSRWARSGPAVASLGRATAVAQLGGVDGGFGGVRARAFVDAIDATEVDLGRLAGQFWGGFWRLGTRRRSSRAGGRCVRLPPHIMYR